jgi:hypothetical protein
MPLVKSPTSWPETSPGAAWTPTCPPPYAQALVGSVSMTAQRWLDERQPSKEAVSAHLVNLCWHGLSHLEGDPQLHGE